MKKVRAIIAMLATALVFGGAMTVISSPAGAEGSDSKLVMSIAEVALEGPAISDIVVSLKNTSDAPMTDVKVKVTGPINWSLYPETHILAESLAAGATTTVTSEIHVPNNPANSVTRNFSATATYAGGDGVKTSFVERNQFTGPIPESLAELFNNVGTTTVETVDQGDYDGEKNSFSRERMAEEGVTPGATITAAGAEFTWPAAEPGKPDNVSANGQSFSFAGQGSKIAFLGSGVAQGAVGEATVHYTDGSSSKGTFGFPNWGFDSSTAHGANLEVSMDGRNTPGGYANAEYVYRFFSNTIDIDPAKSVSMVTLPSSSGIHIFAMAFVPGEVVEPTPEPTETPGPTTSAPATTDPTVAPSTDPTTEPTIDPTQEPTEEPTQEPSQEPTDEPTQEPSATVQPVVTTPGATTAGNADTSKPASPPTAGGDSDLAKTGSAAAPLLGMGGILLAGGLVLMVARRRQRSSHS